MIYLRAYCILVHAVVYWTGACFANSCALLCTLSSNLMLTIHSYAGSWIGVPCLMNKAEQVIPARFLSPGRPKPLCPRSCSIPIRKKKVIRFASSCKCHRRFLALKIHGRNALVCLAQSA
ncbi:hypothetical protein F4782DRAFT_496319 [Xylaria castorea]|nr:hypothetical protein F4782DRAFT_496319 [Xylaria castorea]